LEEFGAGGVQQWRAGESSGVRSMSGKPETAPKNKY